MCNLRKLRHRVCRKIENKWTSPVFTYIFAPMNNGILSAYPQHGAQDGISSQSYSYDTHIRRQTVLVLPKKLVTDKKGAAIKYFRDEYLYTLLPLLTCHVIVLKHCGASLYIMASLFYFCLCASLDNTPSHHTSPHYTTPTPQH